jgi:hypothetical protein
VIYTEGGRSAMVRVRVNGGGFVRRGSFAEVAARGLAFGFLSELFDFSP